jgi:hypothetical protein
LTRFDENWFNLPTLGGNVEAPVNGASRTTRFAACVAGWSGLPSQGAQGQAGTRLKARAPETEEPPQMATKKKTKIAKKSPKTKKAAKRSPKKAGSRKAH